MDVACTLLSPRRDRSRTLYIVMVNEGEMVEGVCKNQTQDNDSKKTEQMSASLQMHISKSSEGLSLHIPHPNWEEFQFPELG